MLSFVFGSFLSAFVASWLLTPLIRRMAPRLGLVDEPGLRKVHVTPTPMGGGIAVFCGLVIAVVFFWLTGATFAAESFGSLMAEVSTNAELRWQMSGIAGGAVILFLLGLADDCWNLSWKLRLGLQVLVAYGVTCTGVQATVFVQQPWIGMAITVLWILVLTNAMNFLDNMDGLSPESA